jgi:hypothetical protein
MSVRINANSMTLEIDDRIVATARYGQHAAADGNGAWVVSIHGARLFTYQQAITTLRLAERLAAGCGEGDPHAIGWRGELGLVTDRHGARGHRTGSRRAGC